MLIPSETLTVRKPRLGTVYPIREQYPRFDLKICVTECGDAADRGSMGAQYVLNALRAAGYHPKYLTPDDRTGQFDLELISVHHCTEFPLVKTLPRRGRVRVLGGHPTTNNIRPVIPFVDAICVGEGEEWIVRAADIVSHGGSAVNLGTLPGTIVRATWERGGVIPATNTVEPLPRHPPYLNRAGDGHAPTWYIEMARGCPFACHYCELGWAWKYRPQDTEFLLAAIRSIDRKQSRKVSLFAPDEASHPGYAECLRAINDSGLTTSFGSMRLDIIVKQNLPLKPNMLVRVGLDGLTETTRFRVKKPLTDDSVWEYFRFMTAAHHRNFKVFMVFGYPWEVEKDVDEFEELFERILCLPVSANTHLRVKFTPFIPQPSTPLGDVEPRYDAFVVARIQTWFKKIKRPATEPGWFVVNDGIMSHRSHALQCLLTRGDESLLIGDTMDWTGTETLKGYDA